MIALYTWSFPLSWSAQQGRNRRIPALPLRSRDTFLTNSSKLESGHFNHKSPCSCVGNRLNKCNPVHVWTMESSCLNQVCASCCTRKKDSPLHSMMLQYEPPLAPPDGCETEVLANHSPPALYPKLLTRQLLGVAVVNVLPQRAPPDGPLPWQHEPAWTPVYPPSSPPSLHTSRTAALPAAGPRRS